jgi:hypothetical protein
MDTGIVDVAAYTRDEMKLDIHELMNPQLRKPVGDCTLKFPHRCRLAGGEIKGSWDAPHSETGAGGERPGCQARV